ncbi:MAG: Ni/Fe hydrogenase subunit alpha [Candidatus Eremiobacterota bacterium]
MSKQRTRTLKVDYLARVEGEGGLFLRVDGDRVVDVKLKIFEPPRFFEAFLRGRRFSEAPDITARICGICPVAYQMSAVHAMERALGVQVEGALRDLRRLLYCGEWIESHVLHVAMLHAPDFLGYPDAIAMAKDHRDLVASVLQLKKAGNSIVATVGGREIHPINVKVGGFYRVPTRGEAADLEQRLRAVLPTARALLDFSAGLEFPDFEQDYCFVSLRHPEEYPMNEGRVVSNGGLDIDVSEWPEHFEEVHVEHSNALHCRLREALGPPAGNYLVGPLARYALNFDRLPATLQEAARKAGLKPVCRNPFQSIVVRSLEVLYALEEALRILASYDPPEQASVELKPRAGLGHAATEAPRGLLYHRYRLDEKGDIAESCIVPPTSQNQATIENDLWNFVPKRLSMADDELTLRCEQAIRNYDPCISCATHFLKLHVEPV